MTTLTSRTSKRLSIACLASMTVICGVAVTSLTSQPGATQFGSALAGDQEISPRRDEGIGATSASRKVQCIMPAAWRKNCSE